MRKTLTRLTIFVAFVAGFVVAIVVMSLLTQEQMSSVQAETTSKTVVAQSESLDELCKASDLIVGKQLSQAKETLQGIVSDKTGSDQAKIASAQLALLEQVQARTVLD